MSSSLQGLCPQRIGPSTDLLFEYSRLKQVVIWQFSNSPRTLLVIFYWLLTLACAIICSSAFCMPSKTLKAFRSKTSYPFSSVMLVGAYERYVDTNVFEHCSLGAKGIQCAAYSRFELINSGGISLHCYCFSNRGTDTRISVGFRCRPIAA